MDTLLRNDSEAEDWQLAARRELIGLKGSARGWGYRKGTKASVEPTVLACLALIASRATPAGPDDAVDAASGWLASIQGRDGSLGLSEGEPAPRWTTPYGLLLWNAVGGRVPACRRAEAWLLGQEGTVFSPSTDPEHIIGHDTMLVGWPWVAGTHSWLEPTALAVMALRGAGHADHPRVREGLRLIRDRAIPGGGWNYGNKAAFGRSLRPQPAPTGQALLALVGSGGRPDVVEDGVEYLLETLPGTRAPASLGWGLLALRAWGRLPADAPGWLAEAYRQSSGRPDAATRLAMLVLAAREGAPALFVAGHRGGRSD